jgi:hypothetical protein
MSATTTTTQTTTRARGTYVHPSGEVVNFSTDRHDGSVRTWEVYYSYVEGVWVHSASTNDPGSVAAGWSNNAFKYHQEQTERDGFVQLPRLAFCPVTFEGVA